MKANIKNLADLTLLLSVPQTTVIVRSFDIFGTLYLKASDHQPGRIEAYDCDPLEPEFTDENYLCTLDWDDFDFERDKIIARFSHRSEYMSDHEFESKYSFLSKDEYEQECLEDHINYFLSHGIAWQHESEYDWEEDEYEYLEENEL